ncbi:MAG: UDP-N-acetylmuramoyl-L-alanyl-D-glutamate--L-lysine ligase [Streptococcaceae bacterium]|jgi:UDP-N-acetylmuramoyl-L-alanyl-D-glutamate-L-lysine ligase|nr:UDP-N-acetylmuramoyl-L-alanyl-D-glutamate--L-lysine ligase [Streptococcaceae bacterium]MCH4176326.1 UDP-N-acetylmuramoyl-L-alanyl-D-glutamate--L-lysine ligase [Streptococcaceae bacterium]
MSIKLTQVVQILKADQNFREILTVDGWYYQAPQEQTFEHLTYNSKIVTNQSLFFIKGLNFKRTYLDEAIQNGLSFYISEIDYEIDIPAIIVNDIKQAMSLIAQAFYDYPNRKLKLLAFTGTKGKTTSAYFAYQILSENPAHRVAMLSTMNTTLDGNSFFKSELTTPESLDLFSMMAKAVNNGMTHLVMEVSSQAYKTKRVYGLTFDVGVFLNISPDHIGPIEHPTFEDYFYCKRQLLHHSKHMVINAEMQGIELIREELTVPTQFYNDAFNQITQSNDFYFNTSGAIAGHFKINLLGKFNQENALAAGLAAAELGANLKEIEAGIEKTTVPGRMEMLSQKNGAKVYIDYAHNKVSLENLIQVVKKSHSGQIIVVIGAPGNKGESRRKDFAIVLSQLADAVILTADDPNHESPLAIAEEIKASITSNLPVEILIDRKEAIQKALTLTKNANDAVILAGKGADLYQIVTGQHEDYLGDFLIAKEIINNEQLKNKHL